MDNVFVGMIFDVLVGVFALIWGIRSALRNDWGQAGICFVAMVILFIVAFLAYYNLPVNG